jgi:hypothetical protein
MVDENEKKNIFDLPIYHNNIIGNKSCVLSRNYGLLYRMDFGEGSRTTGNGINGGR